MKKKILCILIAAMLALFSCACAENVDYVQAALDAADHLSGSNYLLAQDGSVITIGSTRESNTAFYAQLGGLKKLSVSVSGSKVLALTQTGDLYYGQMLIDSGVTDMIYKTTNNDEGAHFIAADGVKYVNSKGRADAGAYTNSFVNLASGKEKELSSVPVYIEADKSDFMVLDADGRLFMSRNTAELYGDLECFEWENLALVDAARVTDGSDIVSLTVAGIGKDGTVSACGDYAQEILSWGSLAYISMADSMIVGLTTDGTVKMTGQQAEIMGSTVESWSNIVAVKAGKCNSTQDIVTAMDADGNFYCAIVWDGKLKTSGMISPEGGSAEVDCKKYAPDGSVTTLIDDKARGPELSGRGFCIVVLTFN